MTTVIPAATPDPTRAEVVGRVEDSFRDVYLTLVSIIQGVALGYLVQVIGPDYRSLGVDHGARGAAIVAFIVAVWQEYMVGATTQAWIPGVLDSLAPFLIGVGEFLMISALSASISDYLFFAICAWAAGLLAEMNYFRHARAARSPASRDSKAVIGVHSRTGPVLGAGGVAFAVLLWVWSLDPATPAALLAALSILPGVAAIASAQTRWTRPMRGRVRCERRRSCVGY